MLKKIRVFAAVLTASCIVFLSGCAKTVEVVKGPQSYSEKGVVIQDCGEYFNVVLDYTKGLSRRDMGRAYARGILKMVPNYEELMDSYLSETHNTTEYRYGLYDVDGLKTQIDPDYKEELEGMADVLAEGTENKRLDDKISKDEFYLFNLMADILGTQCSFCSVYGSRSETGSTIAGRNLDWFGGSKNQISQFQSVVTFKYSNKEIVSIGYLGFMGIITGINDDNSFAAILVSQTGDAYDAQGKRSYPSDLRKALESCSSIDEIADFMSDEKKYYAVNHIIALAEEDKSEILENNFSGFGLNDERVKRAVRTSDSKLNPGTSWGISDAVGSVNSFVLYGNYDNHNHTDSNKDRWETMKRTLLDCGETVSPEELMGVMSYSKGEPGAATTSGCLYNRETTQSVVYQPKTGILQVYFRPKASEENPEHPKYVTVPIFSENE